VSWKLAAECVAAWAQAELDRGSNGPGDEARDILVGHIFGSGSIDIEDGFAKKFLEKAVY
jgi:hypothetical protein